MPTAKNAVALVGASVATMAQPLSAGTVSSGTVSDGTVSDGTAGGDYGLIPDAAVVLENEHVAWLGPQSELPDKWRHADRRDAGGRLITPGLVECHTHLLFAAPSASSASLAASAPGTSGAPGDRIRDGILAIAAATRAASDEDLLAAATRRAWWFIRQGVTTLEVKTGYGLEIDDELRLLRLAGRLRELLPVHVQVTFLAGHTYPPDTDPEDYVMRVCDELLPAATEQGIFDYVEVYCEETAGITMEDASTILETVYRKKLPTRVAADHLSDSAGGALAPGFYCKAAVHLDYTDDVAVEAMARAGTTAVLVPASALELGPPGHRPPVSLLREQGVPMAVSTGFDPTAAPLADLRAAAHLARVGYGLTLPEALHGITSVAARALALGDGTGTLVPGGPADLVVWDAEHPEDLAHWLGAPLTQEVWAAGQRVEAPGQAL
jgi:imidazolonepropionase